MIECGAGMERRDEAVKRTSLRLSKGCVGGWVRGAQHNIGSAVPRYEGTEHKAEERHARKQKAECVGAGIGQTVWKQGRGDDGNARRGRGENSNLKPDTDSVSSLLRGPPLIGFSSLV